MGRKGFRRYRRIRRARHSGVRHRGARHGSAGRSSAPAARLSTFNGNTRLQSLWLQDAWRLNPALKTTLGLTAAATLAIASSVRHPGIAMMLANANFVDKRVTAAVLLFLLVGLVVGIPYKQWIKRTTAHPTAAKPA